MESCRHTCLKLEIPNTTTRSHDPEPIFVKAAWFTNHFDLYITDGLHAWTCHASEEEVKERASNWDQPLHEYIQLAERYLGFQQPASLYSFFDAGNGHKRLSWTFEKEGTKLEWRWKCQPSHDSKKTTAEILDFLMDANIRLSEEVVKKTHLSEQLKVEAEKCLEQSEKFNHEKEEFESAIYAKFLGVLNSKKAKLRELRNGVSKQEGSEDLVEDEEAQSTDRTESYDERSDEEDFPKSVAGTSKDVPATKSRGRGRKKK